MKDDELISYWSKHGREEDHTNIKRHAFKKREFMKFVNTLEGEDKAIADKALHEITRLKDEIELLRHQKQEVEVRNKNLQKELEREKNRLQETLNYFSRWAEGFAKLLKTPMDLGDDLQRRQHYFVLRDSIKNLVVSCRQKITEVDFASENKNTQEKRKA